MKSNAFSTTVQNNVLLFLSSLEKMRRMATPARRLAPHWPAATAGEELLSQGVMGSADRREHRHTSHRHTVTPHTVSRQLLLSRNQLIETSHPISLYLCLPCRAAYVHSAQCRIG